MIVIYSFIGAWTVISEQLGPRTDSLVSASAQSCFWVPGVYLAFVIKACYGYCPCASLVAAVREAYYFHHHCCETTGCSSAAVVRITTTTIIATSTADFDHSIADVAATGPSC